MASDGLHSWRALLRKPYFVHIAASLRHGELYGKKRCDFPGESAVGSAHSRVRGDILGGRWRMAQLSETIYHRESKPTGQPRSL